MKGKGTMSPHFSFYVRAQLFMNYTYSLRHSTEIRSTRRKGHLRERFGKNSGREYPGRWEVVLQIKKNWNWKIGEREDTQEGRREDENGVTKMGVRNGYNLNFRSEMTKCRARNRKYGPRTLFFRTFRTSTFYLPSPNQESF